jgi:hypothetical protein
MIYYLRIHAHYSVGAGFVVPRGRAEVLVWAVVVDVTDGWRQQSVSIRTGKKVTVER